MKTGPEVDAATAYFKKLRSLEKIAGSTSSTASIDVSASIMQRNNGNCSAWKLKYRKISSRVGVNYQATDLPSASLLFTASKEYDQVWNPNIAKKARKLDFIHLVIPHNKKEIAMTTLHELNYSARDLFKELSTKIPLDGSNWTNEEKQIFNKYYYESSRDLTLVSKRMNKSLNNVLTYYYGIYKQSDNYGIQKATTNNHRSKEDGDSQPSKRKCRICKEISSSAITNMSNPLIACDKCNHYYHLLCLKPNLQHFPDANWHCYKCISKDLDTMKRALLINTNLMNNGKRKMPDPILSSDNMIDDEVDMDDICSDYSKRSKGEKDLLCEDDLLSTEEIVFTSPMKSNDEISGILTGIEFTNTTVATSTSNSISSTPAPKDLFRDAAQRLVSSISAIST